MGIGGTREFEASLSEFIWVIMAGPDRRASSSMALLPVTQLMRLEDGEP